MTNEEIIKNNRMIAQKMGDRNDILYNSKFVETDCINYIKYHRSWEWLMPVAQKLKKDIFNTWDMDRNNDVHEYYQQLRGRFYHALEQVDMDKIYKAVVAIIAWHNQVELKKKQ